MKNNTFLLLFLSLYFKCTAQTVQSYSEGFNSSTFSLGTIHGQNGWQAFNDESQVVGGYTVSNDVLAGSQPNFLKVSQDPNFDPSPTFRHFCISPSLGAPIDFVSASGAISFLITQDINSTGPGANYVVQFEGNGAISASVVFINDGSIWIADIIENQFQYFPTNTFWSPGEWKQLQCNFDMVGNTIKYLIDGQQIYEGNTVNGPSVQRCVIYTDNNAGSSAYFDNLSFIGSATPLSTIDNLLSQIRVYPNPANEIISISGLADFINGNITVYTVDGRLIKSIDGNYSDNLSCDISELAAGMYIIDIEHKDGHVRQRFLKQ